MALPAGSTAVADPGERPGEPDPPLFFDQNFADPPPPPGLGKGVNVLPI